MERFKADCCCSSSRDLLPTGIARSSTGSKGGVSCPGRCCLVGFRSTGSRSMIWLLSSDALGLLSGYERRLTNE